MDAGEVIEQGRRAVNLEGVVEEQEAEREPSFPARGGESGEDVGAGRY
ncbi:hypothetical protein HUT06_00425 [Actinomadura sp. NAK00032]|nr:hypothetical protein [Actinomadura sp. NAK00032]QKW32686.1 hypothetical protein HUT06_00425 [Actinomadura sp. NAK00032]